MLVFSRENGEKTKIFLPDGSVITLKVYRYRDGIRLCWDAPNAVKIWRSELVDPSGEPRKKSA